MTHVAMICDNTTIQPLLPQIIIGSEHVLRVRDVDYVRPRVSANVHVWRRSSGWVNANTMLEIWELLAKALQPFMDTCQPILLMDALPAHCAGRVLRAAGRKGLWPMIVPASMTFLLQPLDTDAFLAYKRFLRQRYREMVSDNPHGHVEIPEVILSMNAACRKVLQARAWKHIFDKNGFGAQQARVRQSVLDTLQCGSPVQVSCQSPTLEQFQQVFPRGTLIPFDDLFASLLPRAQTSAARPASHDAPVQDVPRSWDERLRPRRSASRVQVLDSAAEDQACPPLPRPPSLSAASAAWRLLPPSAPAQPPPVRRAAPLAEARPSASARMARRCWPASSPPRPKRSRSSL